MATAIAASFMPAVYSRARAAAVVAASSFFNRYLRSSSMSPTAIPPRVRPRSINFPTTGREACSRAPKECGAEGRKRSEREGDRQEERQCEKERGRARKRKRQKKRRREREESEKEQARKESEK